MALITSMKNLYKLRIMAGIPRTTPSNPIVNANIPFPNSLYK